MKTAIEITHTTGKFNFDGLELILSESGEVIADIRSCNYDGEELENLVYNRSQEEAEANAEFIVTACNNYQSLKEENENLKSALLRLGKRLKAFRQENDGLSAVDEEIILDMYLSTMPHNYQNLLK